MPLRESKSMQSGLYEVGLTFMHCYIASSCVWPFMLSRQILEQRRERSNHDIAREGQSSTSGRRHLGQTLESETLISVFAVSRLIVSTGVTGGLAVTICQNFFLLDGFHIRIMIYDEVMRYLTRKVATQNYFSL